MGDRIREDFCPVDTATQQWIDARSSWILDQFGWERVRSCLVVLPTPAFFPKKYRETETDARLVLDRLCEFFQIDPERLELDFYVEGERADGGPTSAGLYDERDDGTRIWIERSQIHRPVEMAATMAHELCHVLLIGDKRIADTEDDHEPLTDLLTVFLGLGVITANSALHDQTWRSGNLEYWNIHRRGYLRLPMYGYALALFARIREESSPEWSSHLRPDVLDAYRKSLRHFEFHGLPNLRRVITTTARPTLFRPEDVPPEEESEGALNEESALITCTFCGAALPEDTADAICDECRSSIDENQEEILADSESGEALWQTKRNVAKLGCFFMIALLAIIQLLYWLDVHPE